jgi:hypothetical protein
MSGSKKIFLCIAVLVSLSLCFGLSDARATLIVGNTNDFITGGQEVPPVATSAIGSASLFVDSDTGLFDLFMSVTGIALADLAGVGGNNTPVHIHSAAAGANGPIVVDLGFQGIIGDIGGGLGVKLTVAGGTFGGTQGAVNSVTATNIADLIAGNLYINVHTNDHGGGEVRGQITAVQIPEPSTIALCVMGLVGLAAVGRRRVRRA